MDCCHWLSMHLHIQEQSQRPAAVLLEETQSEVVPSISPCLSAHLAPVDLVPSIIPGESTTDKNNKETGGRARREGWGEEEEEEKRKKERQKQEWC